LAGVELVATPCVRPGVVEQAHIASRRASRPARVPRADSRSKARTVQSNLVPERAPGPQGFCLEQARQHEGPGRLGALPMSRL
jgi:hypothetical protein